MQSAFEELGVLLARLMGEPALRMVRDAFKVLDDLFDAHRRDRDVVDWTYLAGVGDLMLCRWCQELRRWAASSVKWAPNHQSLDFAVFHNLADPVAVIAVTADEP